MRDRIGGRRPLGPEEVTPTLRESFREKVKEVVLPPPPTVVPREPDGAHAAPGEPQVVLNEFDTVCYRSATDGLHDLVATLGRGLVVVEIGSFAGGSAGVFLGSGKVDMLYCVDPWLDGYDAADDASDITSRAEHQFDKVMREYRGKYLKVKLSSQEALRSSPLRSFVGAVDVVYIDGNHVYEAVREDILGYSTLLKPGGVLCGHDYVHGHPVLGGVAQAVDGLLTVDKVFSDCSWAVYNWDSTKLKA
jgi:hypothetical protein